MNLSDQLKLAEEMLHALSNNNSFPFNFQPQPSPPLIIAPQTPTQPQLFVFGAPHYTPLRQHFQTLHHPQAQQQQQQHTSLAFMPSYPQQQLQQQQLVPQAAASSSNSANNNPYPLPLSSRISNALQNTQQHLRTMLERHNTTNTPARSNQVEVINLDDEEETEHSPVRSSTIPSSVRYGAVNLNEDEEDEEADGDEEDEDEDEDEYEEEDEEDILDLNDYSSFNQEAQDEEDAEPIPAYTSPLRRSLFSDESDQIPTSSLSDTSSGRKRSRPSLFERPHSDFRISHATSSSSSSSSSSSDNTSSSSDNNTQEISKLKKNAEENQQTIAKLIALNDAKNLTIENLQKQLQDLQKKIDNYKGDKLQQLSYEDLSQLHKELIDVQANVTLEMRNRHVEEKNEKDSMACVICTVERKSVLYSPCMHIAQCSKCPSLDKCPICRKQVLSRTKVFV